MNKAMANTSIQFEEGHRRRLTGGAKVFINPCTSQTGSPGGVGVMEYPQQAEGAGSPPQENASDDDAITKMNSSVQQILVYKKLVVPISMRSVYWKYYGFPASEDGKILTRTKIVCLLCKIHFSYNRNTSNLRMHLQNKHAADLEELEANAPPKTPKEPKQYNFKKSKKQAEHGLNLYATTMDGVVHLDTSRHHAMSNSVLIENLEDYSSHQVVVKGRKNIGHKASMILQMAHSKAEAQNEAETKALWNAITEFIVLDLQNPNAVEGPGLQRLLANFRAPCEIPSRTKLMEELIPSAYDLCKASIRNNLDNASGGVSLCIEEWLAGSGESYVSISVHYQMGGDEGLQSHLLTTLHCSPVYDTIYWTTTLDALLDEWGLNASRVVGVVIATDRLEIITSLDNKQFTLIPCFVYTLQQVIMQACFDQEAVVTILTKVRTMISLICRYHNALTLLRIQEHLQQLDECQLVLDYPRIWMSTYTMLEQILLRRSCLANIFENIDPSVMVSVSVSIEISEQEWSLIEDIVNTLEPFKVTIMTLSEETNPLISLLKPLLWQLISSHLKLKEEDSENCKIFKTSLSTLLNDRYKDDNVTHCLRIATVLDPRFKQMPSIAEAKAILWGSIKDEIVKMMDQKEEKYDVVAHMKMENATPKKPRLSGRSMEMLLGSSLGSPAAMVASPQERVELELVQYHSEPTPLLDQCPIAWWRSTGPRFPHLTQLAMEYSTMPAAVIPPLRISHEPQIQFDMKRASLWPEVADKVLFLNANFSPNTS